MALRLVRVDLERGAPESADARVAEVLEQALESDLHEPAIEAMRYAGDIALDRGDAGAARDFFERALARVDETGFTSMRAPIASRLVSIYLDEGDLAAAEALLGYLVEQEPNAYDLSLRARYAYLVGEGAQAVTLMTEAKSLAGERWGDSEETTLARYRESAARGGEQ